MAIIKFQDSRSAGHSGGGNEKEPEFLDRCSHVGHTNQLHGGIPILLDFRGQRQLLHREANTAACVAGRQHIGIYIASGSYFHSQTLEAAAASLICVTVLCNIKGTIAPDSDREKSNDEVCGAEVTLCCV